MRGSLLIHGAEGGGGASFGDITGAPTDNAALAAALAARVGKAGDTITGALTSSAIGTASTPALKLTGAWFTGGTGTTTKPQILIEPAGASSTGWSSGGTGLGVNAPGGFTGMLADLQVDGMSKFAINPNGTIIHNSTDVDIASNGMSWMSFAGSGSGINLWTTYGGVLINKESYVRFSEGNGSRATILRPDPEGGGLALAGCGGDFLPKPCYFHLYKLGNSAEANFERLALQSGSGYLEIASQSGGTGTADLDLRLASAGAGVVDFHNQSLTPEAIVGNRSFTMKIGGTTVKVPCVV